MRYRPILYYSGFMPFVQFFLCILLLFCTTGLFAQSLVPPELGPEDPEALISAELSDVSVDFFLAGSWQSAFSASFGWAVVPGTGLVSNYLYPGFVDGWSFVQTPDLTLQALIEKRWLLETTIVEDYRLSTWLAGYRGKKGEFVRQVRIGNTGTGISSYPWLDIPGPGRSSPGISALFETGPVEWEFLLRYDPSLSASDWYVGRRKTTDLRVAPSKPLRGRFFVLPDNGLESVALWLEDRNGSLTGSDGRHYRPVRSDEAELSAADGIVRLKTAAKGRVLVWYRAGGLPVGAAGLGGSALPRFVSSSGGPWRLDASSSGLVFDWSGSGGGVAQGSGDGTWTGRQLTEWRVTLAGNDCLLLYEPGAFNPFEDLSWYETGLLSPLPESGTSLLLANAGGATEYGPAASSIQITLGPNRLLVRAATTGAAARSVQARLPFGALFPSWYGPDAEAQNGQEPVQILVRRYIPQDDYLLPADVIPGSVEVFVNGTAESRVTIDYGARKVFFLAEPLPSDRIEIRYRTTSSQGSGGDLLLVTAARLFPGQDLNASLAFLLRWNVLQESSFSSAAGDHPGQLALSAAFNWKQGPASISLDAVGALVNPDTTGRLRLWSMEEGGQTVDIDKNRIFPASVPDTASVSSFSPAMLASPARTNRGRLLYRNYQSLDAFGIGHLNDYTWDLPAGHSPDYASGQNTGPYAATALADGLPGQIMVLDWQMDDGDTWTAAQIPLASGDPDGMDLSGTSAIRFAWKVAAAGPARLHVQVGAIGEDLDGDGILDEEASENAAGFDFNDGALILKVGAGPLLAGNRQQDSEDMDASSTLDGEVSSLIASHTAGLDASSAGGWQVAEIRLDNSARSRLARSRAVRFVLSRQSSSTGSAAGRILIGGLVFEGSSAAISRSGNATVDLRDVAESLGQIVPATSLAAAHPDVLGLFHSGGATQKVAEVRWSSAQTADTWTLRRQTSALPLSDYRQVVLYLRQAQAVGGTATYTLRYRGPDGAGLELPFSLAADNGWKKLVIEPARGKAWLNSTELAGLQVDATASELSSFELVQTGTTDGVLYLDELHASSASQRLRGAGSARLSWESSQALWSLGDVVMLGAHKAEARLWFQLPHYYLEDGSYDEGWLRTQGSAQVALGGLLLTKAGLEAETGGGLFQLAGSHELALPPDETPGWQVREVFFQSYDPETAAMSHLNSLALALPGKHRLELRAEQRYSIPELWQHWSVLLDPPGDSDDGLDLSVVLGQSSRGWTETPPLYAEAWTSVLPLILPWEQASSPVRSMVAEASFSSSTRPLGLDALVELSWISQVASANLSLPATSAGFELSLPFAIILDGAEKGSITLSWNRDASLTLEGSPASFTEDAAHFWNAWQSSGILWNALPLSVPALRPEESSLALFTAGLPAASLADSVSLAAQRNPLSSWLDLLLPSSLDVSCSRTLLRGYDNLSGNLTLQAGFGSLAVNVFGAVGSASLTSLFYADQYEWGFDADWTFPEPAGIVTWTIAASQSASFYFVDNSSAGLDSEMEWSQTASEWSWSWTLGTSYAWRLNPAPDFGLPLLQQAIKEGSHYLNTERLDISLKSAEGSLGFLFTHTTAFIVPNKGNLSVDLQTGLTVAPGAGSSSGSAALVMWGVQLVISASFLF